MSKQTCCAKLDGYSELNGIGKVRKGGCSENQTAFSIEAPSSEDFCRLDLSKQKGKCDYVFIHCKRKKIVFVELKSRSKVKKAIEQLVNTYDKFQQHINAFEAKGYYVYLSVPAKSDLLKSLKKYKRKDFDLKPLKSKSQIFDWDTV